MSDNLIVSITEEGKHYDKSKYFSGSQILNYDQDKLTNIYIDSHCSLDGSERMNLAENIDQVRKIFSEHTDNNINSLWIGVFDIGEVDTDKFKEREIKGGQEKYWKNSIHVEFGNLLNKVLVYSWLDINQFNQDKWNNLLSQLHGDNEIHLIGTGPITFKYKDFNYCVCPPLFGSLYNKGSSIGKEVFNFFSEEVNQIIEDIKESHQLIEKKIIDRYQSLGKNFVKNGEGYIYIQAGIDGNNRKYFTDVSYTNRSDDIYNKPIKEAFIKEEELNSVGNFLHFAVYKDDKSLMEKLLGMRSHVNNINTVNKNDRTPLHLAAKYGRKEIVEMLLNKEAKVDVVDNRGRTPLHLAAQNNNKEIVEMLLNKEAKVDIADNRGRTPLHLAAKNGHMEVVRALLDKGANVKAEDEDGKTPFNLADNEEIKTLLQNTAELLEAVKNGNVQEVERLISEGASVNTKDNDGQTPLHFAVSEDKIDIVKALLGATGINVNTKDNDGQTPLHFAVSEDKIDIVKALLGATGINVNAVDKSGQTPLHLAAQNNNKEIVDALLKVNGINVNAVDKSGQTPFDLTTNEEIKTLLKEAAEKTDPVSTDNEGDSEEEEGGTGSDVIKKENSEKESQGKQDISGEKGTDVTIGSAQPVAPTESSAPIQSGDVQGTTSTGEEGTAAPTQNNGSTNSAEEEQPSSFFGSLFSILMKPFSLIASFFGGFFSWLFGSDTDESTSQTDASVSPLKSDSLDEKDNSGDHYDATKTDV